MRDTPLDPSYRECPYWWDDAPPAVLEPQALPTDADVVVIGGGYTGVAAARELARRGRRVVVAEARGFGFGASGRNGGQVHPGLHDPVPRVFDRWRGQGRSLYDLTVRAFELVEHLIEEERITCDYVRTGHLELAHSPAAAVRMRNAARSYARLLDQDARYVERDELTAEVGTTVYRSGLIVGKSGSLHPAKYLGGLVTAAKRSGAELHANTLALAVGRDRDGRLRVSTDRGDIRAGSVLLATNGYTSSLVPRVQRGVIPIGSYMIATEPLPTGVAKSISPRRRTLFDSKRLLSYWKLTPDDRVVFGGRTSGRDVSVSQARDALYREMLRIYPVLKETRVTHAWEGRVAFTLDFRPHVGILDGVAYALGYCGGGIALGTYLGTQAGAWLAGEKLTTFGDSALREVPMYHGQPWFVPAIAAGYKISDRIAQWLPLNLCLSPRQRQPKADL